MKTKYLEIDNFSDEEVTEMFDAIHTDFINVIPKKGKKTLGDLLLLIDKHQLSFTFKVECLEADISDIKPEIVIPEPHVDVIHSEMSKQLEEVKGVVIEPIIEEKKLDFSPGDLPDFDLS